MKKGLWTKKPFASIKQLEKLKTAFTRLQLNIFIFTYVLYDGNWNLFIFTKIVIKNTKSFFGYVPGIKFQQPFNVETTDFKDWLAGAKQ